MCLDKNTGAIRHHIFSQLPELLSPGDCLVLNDSRVLPARLLGRRISGAAVELVLLRDIGEMTWECLARPGRRVREGDVLEFGGGELGAEVIKVAQDGNRHVRFSCDGVFLEVLERLGQMPLPPYITKELTDSERYQTVYSKEPGSAAAPTAGLHFTPELLERLVKQGIRICCLTLHVGLGTFRPVKAEKIEDHHMHSEFYIIPPETAELINKTRAEGGKIVAVGTTSCRSLESGADERGQLTEKSGWTDIFIYPGYEFKCIDALITNFHLPESTLIMLVSALAGRENTLNAYERAVSERYRFFSFGDSMIIM
jgi:S-adenosylmethionine:tRNA ribosyltransferase-isomerase